MNPKSKILNQIPLQQGLKLEIHYTASNIVSTILNQIPLQQGLKLC